MTQNPNTTLPKEPRIKTYRALLSQFGTSAPVQIVLLNTLGGTITWTRTDVGNYTGALTGTIFPQYMTTGLIGNRYGFISFTRNDNDSVQIQTANIAGSASDYILSETLIEINIYE